MRRINPWLINASAGLALVAGGLWLAPQFLGANGWSFFPEQTAESLSAVGLSVEEVLVHGRQKTVSADILDALGAVRGTPILDVDIPGAKIRIGALPWVRSAEIVRHLPNSLHITLDEYEAFALWQHDETYTLIDRDGTSILDVAATSTEMPVVVGADAPAHTQALFAVLEEQPELRQRVKAAVRFGGRRWNVVLDNMETGITVKLPETNIALAWNGLAALDAKNKILSRAISEIDMRIAGRLVVQLKDGYAPIPQQSRYSPNARDVSTDAPVARNKELSKGV
jgi:cell division protein FtsQ